MANLIVENLLSTQIVKEPYFLKKEIKLTGSRYLPGKVCYSLNESMIMPSEESSPRQRHFYYPNLYLYYNLAIYGQLLKTSPKGKSLYIFPDLDRIEQFFDFSDTEQYITLLEILWIHTDWEDLHSPERHKSPAYRIHHLLEKVAAIQKVSTTLDKNELGGFTWDLWPFAKYLEYFGFWEANFDSSDKTRFRHLEACKPSSLGIELARILTKKRKIGLWNRWEKFEGGSFLFDLNDENFTSQEELDIEASAPEKEPFLIAFQHLFSKGELNRSLSIEESEFREGNYIFKISFKYSPKIWRKISLSAKDTLHELHQMIQEAIEFGDDHLYAFYPDNKLPSRLSYQSPMSDYGVSATEILIGDLQIHTGQAFIYYFDFGASWEFKIVLEEIDNDSVPLKKGEIISAQGKAPNQYPNFEDDDWD